MRTLRGVSSTRTSRRRMSSVSEWNQTAPRSATGALAPPAEMAKPLRETGTTKSTWTQGAVTQSAGRGGANCAAVGRKSLRLGRAEAPSGGQAWFGEELVDGVLEAVVAGPGVILVAIGVGDFETETVDGVEGGARGAAGGALDGDTAGVIGQAREVGPHVEADAGEEVWGIGR